MTAIDTIIVGAGGRGKAYSKFALEYPQELRVVGVAEPDPQKRESLARDHDIPPDMAFEDWQSLLRMPGKKAATIINCTMDRDHFESTMRMLDSGYDVLLEKPMTPVLRENLQLVQKAEAAGRPAPGLPRTALHAVLASLARGCAVRDSGSHRQCYASGEPDLLSYGA